MSRQTVLDMMRSPTQAAIYAAELRAAQSRLQMRDSAGRARKAFRSALKRPSVLVGVAAAASLGAFWLMRRPRKTTKAPSAGLMAAAAVTIGGLVRASILRYGTQYATAVFRQFWTPRQRPVAKSRPTLH